MTKFTWKTMYISATMLFNYTAAHFVKEPDLSAHWGRIKIHIPFKSNYPNMWAAAQHAWRNYSNSLIGTYLVGTIALKK